MRAAWVWVAVSLGMACSGASDGSLARPTSASIEPASLVLRGGSVMTMWREHPTATAIAVRAGRVVFVGDDDGVRDFIGSVTRVVELGGRTVTPGLVDAHSHLYGLGKSLEEVNLRGAASAVEAAKRVAVDAAKRGPDEWVTGRGWDQNRWTPAEFPSHRVLDKLVARRPVAVRRVDGHAMWVNAAAMKRAGVTRDTKDPAGGQIVRDATGEPTGVFIDAAMDLIGAHIPAPSDAVRERRILAAAKQAVSVGLAGVHEMGIGLETLAVYKRLATQRKLPLRVYAFLAGDAKSFESLTQLAPVRDDGTGFLVVRAIKLFADGALGSRGAALLAPYTDSPKSVGLWLTSPADLTRAARLAATRGWQLGVHAIGDAANRSVLDAFAVAIRDNPGADLRFRVEHAQVLSPADLPRFAKLGVIASMQPTHATSDMPWAEKRLGPARIKGAYAWRTLIDSGAHVAAGSDFPVEHVPPMFGIHAAVNRTDHSGQPAGGWYPSQKMTLDEAVGAFTIESAYASFSEGNHGQVRVGFVADLTVFDQNLKTAGERLHAVRADVTIVAGKVVYERK